MGSGSSGYNIRGTRGSRDAGYAGGADHQHALAENAGLLRSAYPMHEGYFGQKSSTSRVRRIHSDEPLATARDFYRRASQGGVERASAAGRPRITEMADGTTVSFRETSRDGSPVVEIHPPTGIDTDGIKYQKIHFMRNGE